MRQASHPANLLVFIMPRLITLFLMLAVPAMADAQERIQPGQEDEVILVTASRIPVQTSEVTAAATILDAGQIEARGDQYVADALRQVPGAAVNRSGPVGSLTQVRLRGSEANHVLVLMDGMPVSDPFTGSFAFASAASAGVNRIEIMRGEQSALWGTDAIGGVIHLLSEPDTHSPYLRAHVEAGQMQSYSGSLFASRTSSRSKIWGSVSGTETEGYDVSNSGPTGEKDGFRQIAANMGLNYNIHSDWQLQIRGQGHSSRSEFDTDLNFDGRLNDVELMQDTEFGSGQITLQGNTHNETLAHLASLSYLQSHSEAQYNKSEGSRTALGWQSTAKWKTDTIAHQATLVGEARFETYLLHGSPFSGSRQARDNQMTGLAGEYTGRAGPVIVSLSARFEANDLFQDTSAIRAGMAWRFPAINGKLRASAGQGIKNPGYYELFGFSPNSFVGNPDLSAEKSTGYELGWEQVFDRASISLSLFHADLNDEIHSVFKDGAFTADNRANPSSRDGIEIAGQWQMGQGFLLMGSASLLNAKENDLPELRRPDFLASVSMYWSDPSKNWTASFSLDHNGSMQDIDFTSFSRVTLPAFTLARARISHKINPAFEVYLRAENLFDKEYTEVVGYASQGRNIYGGITAAF